MAHRPLRASADQVLALPRTGRAAGPVWDGARPTPSLLQAEESVRAQAGFAGRSRGLVAGRRALCGRPRLSGTWPSSSWPPPGAARLLAHPAGRCAPRSATVPGGPGCWGLACWCWRSSSAPQRLAWRLQSERDARREQVRAAVAGLPGVRGRRAGPDGTRTGRAQPRRAGRGRCRCHAWPRWCRCRAPRAQSARFAGGELSLVGVPLESAAWEQACARLAAQATAPSAMVRAWCWQVLRCGRERRRADECLAVHLAAAFERRGGCCC